MQERINTAKGEASAIEANAVASAKAVRALALAIRADGGMDACSLRVAEQYVNAFKAIAGSGGTVVVPANAADVGGMVAQAMAVYNASTKQTRGALSAAAGEASDDLDLAEGLAALGLDGGVPATTSEFGEVPASGAESLPPSPQSDFAPEGVPGRGSGA